MAKEGYVCVSSVGQSQDEQQSSATLRKGQNMFRKSIVAVASLAVLVSSPIVAETNSGDAGPMTFEYDNGKHQANINSTLKKKWVVVNDPNLPAQISNYAGIDTIYDSFPTPHWLYVATYEIVVTEPIVAFEVRIIPFDIWGESETLLSTTEIHDLWLGNGELNQFYFDGAWSILREGTATKHYASVAYIAQVKLQSGEILRADTGAILERARNFKEDFSAGDLELQSELRLEFTNPLHPSWTPY